MDGGHIPEKRKDGWRKLAEKQANMRNVRLKIAQYALQAQVSAWIDNLDQAAKLRRDAETVVIGLAGLAQRPGGARKQACIVAAAPQGIAQRQEHQLGATGRSSVIANQENSHAIPERRLIV